jgi:hypothetical protein
MILLINKIMYKILKYYNLMNLTNNTILLINILIFNKIMYKILKYYKLMIKYNKLLKKLLNMNIKIIMIIIYY